VFDEKLKDKLARLLALTASPEENEARTAAWLLVDTCRKNGVTICFRKKGEPITDPAPRAQPGRGRVAYAGTPRHPGSAFGSQFDDLMDAMRYAQAASTGYPFRDEFAADRGDVFRRTRCIQCGAPRAMMPIQEGAGGRFVHARCAISEPPEVFEWRPIPGARTACPVCGTRFSNGDHVLSAYGTTVHASCA
jgi:hypothetical protein